MSTALGRLLPDPFCCCLLLFLFLTFLPAGPALPLGHKARPPAAPLAHGPGSSHGLLAPIHPHPTKSHLQPSLTHRSVSRPKDGNVPRQAYGL